MLKNLMKKNNSLDIPIVQDGDPVLRELAQTVPVKDITSETIRHVIADMQKALASQDDGVAIAAPQIGVPLRIFCVSGAVLDAASKEFDTRNDKDTSGEASDETPHKELGKDKRAAKKTPDLIFINPEIIKLSRDKEDLDEGCLSVRYLYGKVRRAKKVSIRAYDEYGKKIERGAAGLLAQVFQHEIDHLDGILFIDKARDVEEVIPDHIKFFSVCA